MKILFSTFSLIGPVMETATMLVDMPVLRVDQPMADNTVQMSSKIDVIATLSTTIEHTIDLERRRAIITGKEFELVSRIWKALLVR